jgi:hypothetical protein
MFLLAAELFVFGALLGILKWKSKMNYYLNSLYTIYPPCLIAIFKYFIEVHKISLYSWFIRLQHK